MRALTAKLALRVMLLLLSVILIFHVLVLVQVIPYTIVWAGKLHSVTEMQTMEAVSISINLLLLVVLLMKGGLIRARVPIALLNGIIWVFIALFLLNTVGNLFAATSFERYVFTPLTLLFAFLCWRIVSGNPEKADK